MLLYVLIPVAWSLQCKSFACNDLPNNECISVSENAIIFSKCPVGLECPEVSLLAPSNQTCELPRVKEDPAECIKTAKLGQVCGPIAKCASGLHCSLDGVCAPAKMSGEKCSKLDECGEGMVCNIGSCVPYFSVETGQAAESKVACASVILSQGICQPKSETLGSLPIMCRSDDDCKGSDDTLTSCYCAGGGLAFCALHASDKPVKEYLAAVHDGLQEKSAALLLKVIHYPQIQAIGTCADDHLMEFKELAKNLEWYERCAALAFSFISILAVLSLS